MTGAQLTSRVVKPLVFVACAIPAALLVWGAFSGGLGANPVEVITHETGQWGLRLLMVTLLITPLRKLSGWSSAIRLRRMLGLYSFFYVVAHFTTYIWLDHSLIVSDIVEDIVKRPYVTAGFVALLCMTPLAVTSTNAMIKRLGARNWARLHRLVYLAGAGAVLHFIWLVKADLREPLIYLAIFAVLMALRMPSIRSRIGRRKSASPRTEPELASQARPPH